MYHSRGSRPLIKGFSSPISRLASRSAREKISFIRDRSAFHTVGPAVSSSPHRSSRHPSISLTEPVSLSGLSLYSSTVSRTSSEKPHFQVPLWQPKSFFTSLSSPVSATSAQAKSPLMNPQTGHDFTAGEASSMTTPTSSSSSSSSSVPSTAISSSASPNGHTDYMFDVKHRTNVEEMYNHSPWRGVCNSGKLTNKVTFFDSGICPLPVLRCLRYDGILHEDSQLPFSLDEGKRLFKIMVTVSIVDSVLYDIQRQGRISFYMTNSGEEAATVGVGAALEKQDILFPQYRELGALMSRGFKLTEILDQCFGSFEDEGKARQMPVHYSSRRLNIQTISSPLGTQIPQAVGAGYAFSSKNENCVSVVFFGEGAASEGDCSVALNFASTLGTQTIFVCRNNGLAISTPVEEQYRGDGIGGRGLAFGIKTLRVDGNDLAAVYTATKEARKVCIQEKRPVLLELMTYRVGHHSTSDDASRYRMGQEVQLWQEEGITPISRMSRFLINSGVWTSEETDNFRKQTRKLILSEMKRTEKKKKPAFMDGLFSDVYSDMPWNLREQKAKLEAHLSAHADKYDLSEFHDAEVSC